VQVADKKQIERSAKAANPRVPLSLVRRCAILAVGAAAILIDATSRLLDQAQAAVAHELRARRRALERGLASLLDRLEREA
jgi:hypothetical protein